MWRSQQKDFERPKGIRFRRRKVLPKTDVKRSFENPFFERKKPSLTFLVLRSYWHFFLFLVFVGAAVYVFLFSDFFNIKNVVVEGNENITYDSFRYIANLSFVERRWLAVRQRNIFALRIKTIHDRLWAQLPLERLSVKKKFPSTLVITVREKIPGVVFMVRDQNFYLDLKGEIAKPVEFTQINPRFPKVHDENERPVEVREKVLSERMVEGVLYLQDRFPTIIAQDISEFIVPKISCTETKEVEKQVIVPLEQGSQASVNTNSPKNSNTNKVVNGNKNSNKNVNNALDYTVVEKVETVEEEVPCRYADILSELHVKTKSGWQAYFDTAGNLSDQLAALQVTLKESVKDIPHLQYVDVRIPSRVFYKD